MLRKEQVGWGVGLSQLPNFPTSQLRRSRNPMSGHEVMRAFHFDVVDLLAADVFDGDDGVPEDVRRRWELGAGRWVLTVKNSWRLAPGAWH